MATVAVALTLALGGAGAGTARAQAKDEAAIGSLPEKNQHVFVPTSFIPDPFIHTTLGLTMGYSTAIRTDIPVITPGGQTIGTVPGDLLFLNGGFEFHYAMRDWIGLFGRFTALARSGSNTATLLASGMSAGSGFATGWEFRLAEDEKSILSGSIEAGSTAVTVINVRGYIDDPSVGLAHSYTPLVANANARYAHGVNGLFGYSAYAGGGYGENPKDNLNSTWFWRLGGVASFNLEPTHHVPLGFALGLRTSSYPLTFDKTRGNSWSGLASIAYMGRPDLALTMDTVFERVPIDYRNLTISYVGVTVGLKYCF